MRTGIFEFAVEEAFSSLKHNRAMGWVAFLTVTITLCLVGLALLVSANLDHMAGMWAQEAGVVVFFKPDATSAQEQKVLEKVKQLPEVKKVTFVSKTEALRRLQERFGKRLDLSGFAENNPLPDSLELELFRPLEGERIAKALEGFAGIDEVLVPEKILQRLRLVSFWGKVLAFVMLVLFILSALVIIGNTVRLTVLSRARQVEIMRLVGATEGLIRAPFILEGTFVGLLGGFFSAVLVGALYEISIKALTMKMPFLPVVEGLQLMFFCWLGLPLLGALAGFGGSFLAVKKCLDELEATTEGALA